MFPVFTRPILSSSILQLSEGHLTVRANLGDSAHRLQLPGHRLDMGQWVQVGLSRYGNLFVLRLEQGGGDREVQARLGSKTELLLDPDGVTVGGGPEWDRYHYQDQDQSQNQDQDKEQGQNQNQEQGQDKAQYLNQEQDFQGEFGFRGTSLVCFHRYHMSAAPFRLSA